MQNYIIAVIRTLVPLAVGWIAAHLHALIPALPAPPAEAVETITVLVASLYYIAVAWLERKFPWFGWLLGIARNPVYDTKAARDEVLAWHSVLEPEQKLADEAASRSRVFGS